MTRGDKGDDVYPAGAQEKWANGCFGALGMQRELHVQMAPRAGGTQHWAPTQRERKSRAQARSRSPSCRDGGGKTWRLVVMFRRCEIYPGGRCRRRARLRGETRGAKAGVCRRSVRPTGSEPWLSTIHSGSFGQTLVLRWWPTTSLLPYLGKPEARRDRSQSVAGVVVVYYLRLMQSMVLPSWAWSERGRVAEGGQ